MKKAEIVEAMLEVDEKDIEEARDRLNEAASE